MSDVSSGLIKLAYRGFAGFFVFLFMFIFGVVGFALGMAGGIVIGDAIREVADLIQILGDQQRRRPLGALADQALVDVLCAADVDPPRRLSSDQNTRTT